MSPVAPVRSPGKLPLLHHRLKIRSSTHRAGCLPMPQRHQKKQPHFSLPSLLFAGLSYDSLGLKGDRHPCIHGEILHMGAVLHPWGHTLLSNYAEWLPLWHPAKTRLIVSAEPWLKWGCWSMRTSVSKHMAMFSLVKLKKSGSLLAMMLFIVVSGRAKASTSALLSAPQCSQRGKFFKKAIACGQGQLWKPHRSCVYLMRTLRHQLALSSQHFSTLSQRSEKNKPWSWQSGRKFKCPTVWNALWCYRDGRIHKENKVCDFPTPIPLFTWTESRLISSRMEDWVKKSLFCILLTTEKAFVAETCMALT